MSEGNKATILIADDEKEIRDLINIYLKGEGYDTILAEDGEEAIKYIEERKIDLIILDIMMPKVDGIAVCMKVREKINTPIIMLSAKAEDMDKILGLTTGADDYVTKPFNPLELIARVKSQLRRYTRLNNMVPVAESRDDEIIAIDDLKINIVNHQVFVGDEEKKLTPTEFDILSLLAQNRGKVFSIENIYESVWKEDFMESDNTVMVHIRKIREKLGENSRMPKYIKTVWGVGYKVEK